VTRGYLALGLLAMVLLAFQVAARTEERGIVETASLERQPEFVPGELIIKLKNQPNAITY